MHQRLWSLFAALVTLFSFESSAQRGPTATGAPVRLGQCDIRRTEKAPGGTRTTAVPNVQATWVINSSFVFAQPNGAGGTNVTTALRFEYQSFSDGTTVLWLLTPFRAMTSTTPAFSAGTYMLVFRPNNTVSIRGDGVNGDWSTVGLCRWAR